MFKITKLSTKCPTINYVACGSSHLFATNSNDSGKTSKRLEEFRKKLRQVTPLDKVEEFEEGKHPYQEKEPLKPFPNNVNPDTGEIDGPRGPEPTRYGDWEHESGDLTFNQNNSLSNLKESETSERMKEFREKLKAFPHDINRIEESALIKIDPKNGKRSPDSEDPTKWGDWQYGGRVTDF